jgi:dihydrofolate reductase
MKAIVAMSKNRCIGKNNNLPWHVPEDFLWFKEFTTGKILVVGHNTYDTLPPLKNRNLIIVSKNPLDYKHKYDPLINSAYCFEYFQNILEINKYHNRELIVIGGSKTYESFMPYITEFYVTHINGDYEGDTFMPKFEHLFENREVIKEFNGGHKVCKFTK